MNNKLSFGIVFVGVIIISLILYMVYCFNVPERVAHSYYQVYLGGQKIGLIKSDDELYSLIDKEQQAIKDLYNVNKIYPPSGLKVKEVITYNNDILSAKEVYEEIKDIDPFTIEGYEISVKYEEETKRFYILNKNNLDSAIRKTVLAFLDEEDYDNYINGTQQEVTDEGIEITNVYLDQQVSIKKALISTEEKIITDEDELSQYFLFGTTELKNKYTVKSTDTIESIAYSNELGVQDFLIANPDIVSEKALLAVGQEVSVAPIDPIANVVVESFQTENQVITYDTKVEYDKTMDASKSYTKTEGKNGLSRVTYATKEMNGVILNTALVSSEVVYEATDKVVVMGAKNIVYVGNSTFWAWPTARIYRISSHYGYRIHPVYKYEKFHDGTDITGTPSDNIYAIQSGIVKTVTRQGSMGKYIKIDHQNGYTSSYLHLSKQLVSVGDKVEKGQLIGIMGCTGTCTGKHLHLTITKNGSKMNPLLLYQ